MKNPLDPTLRELNDCGGCAGTAAETPRTIENRPGLGALSFRAGTQPQFLVTMLTALSADQRPTLARLKTRDPDDFTIALLDAWATVGDVLTFYSERIANESFLRTATERRSILELARSIGYELNPGVAASTWLNFTIESAPGAPGYALIPRGAQVQSIPVPSEKPQLPQTYETLEPLFARKEWNKLLPRHTDMPVPYLNQTTLRLQGTTTNLRPGDALLIVGDERKGDPTNENWDFRRVKSLATFPNAETPHTLVTLDRGLGSEAPTIQPAQANAKVYALRQRLNLFGYNAPDPRTLQFKMTGLLGEYFQATNFARRVFTRVDPTVDFNWSVSPPGAGLGTTNYSVRWTGVVKTGAAGRYFFSTSSDDGVRLWVNGQLLIDKWVTQSTTTWTGDILLEADKFYDLRLEYFQGGGAAEVHLSWTEPGQSSRIIPADRLFRIELPAELPAEWPGLTLADISGTAPGAEIAALQLEGTHPEVIAGSWLVVFTPEYQELYGVTSVAEDSRSGFTLNAKTTKVGVAGENLRLEFNERVRAITVFAQSEELPRVPEPVYSALFGEEIALDQAVPEPPAGRGLLVSGLPARLRGKTPGLQWHGDDGTTRVLGSDEEFTLLAAADLSYTVEWTLLADDGKRGSVLAAESDFRFLPPAEDAPMLIEVATVRRSLEQNGVTVIELTEPLRNAYSPTTMAIAGNVAFSTHGASVREEVLGSGDASLAHQRFTLREAPVTFTPASTPSGGKSSLEIWVNDVRWSEVPTLFARGPRERIYVARRADKGEVTVTFGDGTNGARLPTGQENVRARYRKGVGLEGVVNAGQLTLLMTRPLGVKDVINPLAGSGAADPQEFKDARRNAPLTVLTLDRLVSLQDYEDFSRNFSGVAKALASWTWSVGSRGIFMTVSGPAGAAVAEGTATEQGLIEALREFGNPRLPVVVKSFSPVTFSVAGTIFAAPDRVADDVLAAVREALLAHFSFDARDFGQPVALSEVVGVMQNVPGVIAVDLDALFLTGNVSERKMYLAAAKPRNGASSASAAPAELLTIDPASLQALKVQTAS